MYMHGFHLISLSPKLSLEIHVKKNLLVSHHFVPYSYDTNLRIHYKYSCSKKLLLLSQTVTVRFTENMTKIIHVLCYVYKVILHFSCS